MEKYLRSYEEYLAVYDRETISQLKELEQSLLTDEKQVELGDFNDPESNAYQVFLSVAVKRDRDRFGFVDRQIEQANAMDALVARTKRPVVYCQVCGKLMKEDGHTFRNDNRDIVFFFKCPAVHFPKRLVYPDGKTEIHLKPKQCVQCGGVLRSATEETESQLVFIDTCIRCGHVDRMELTMDKPEPVDEQERKKYCLDFAGKKTRLEELTGFLELVERIMEPSEQEGEEAPKAKPAVKIEQVHIPEIEARVTTCLEQSGYIKVVFQVPQPGEQVLIDFTCQDPTKRPESTSLRLLRKQLNELLSKTNWRLAKDAVYRMGMLSAQLIGYDQKADLLKLAKRRKK